MSKNTVHKYINKELRLLSIYRRKRLGYKKGYVHKLFLNLLNQAFTIDCPNMIWRTNFTYISLTNGAIGYNFTIIGLYDRSVVTIYTRKSITNDLAIETLQKASICSKTASRNLIVHFN
ncbi:hypothetical protein [Zhenhengia yiwuensis]|uniref:Integrase catalytic domain-containing protein n=1 Tax=Zhenhengia yiwuensis TaxID=2763666 RepID=A0A926EJ13_9FIRM|nr:hypothetical protein [Zhenhengia yiwuensis]MBC8578958.1 hypothetical protein [Zhenhengia yiwuensis]